MCNTSHATINQKVYIATRIKTFLWFIEQAVFLNLIVEDRKRQVMTS